MSLNDSRGQEALKPKSSFEVTTSISQKAKGYESERIKVLLFSRLLSQKGTRIQEITSTRLRIFRSNSAQGPQKARAGSDVSYIPNSREDKLQLKSK